MNSDTFTITLGRRFIEHPEAVHVRRMRAAVWLYLALLSRLPPDGDTVEITPRDLAWRMGLPEGTIRSWLGHLRRGRYVETRRLNGTVQVLLKQVARPAPRTPEAMPEPEEPNRFFTVAKLARALGEAANEKSLAEVLDNHPDAVIQKALAATLAVPDSEIRRSRTALFLYLLKRHAEED